MYIVEEKHPFDEAAVEKQKSKNQEPDKQSRKPKIRLQEEYKESQTTLILRPYKTKKSITMTMEEKRKANKLGGHACATYKISDANRLSQEYHFSS